MLTLAGKRVWALNFPVGSMDTIEKRITAAYDPRAIESIDYSVQKRHAEMRLILKLADQHTHGTLDIDKVCCVFCASQLIALGYRNVIVGRNRGVLNWYTFSPIVMYFQERRRAMWGDAMDLEFMQLTLVEKLTFLRMLVAQTKLAAKDQPPLIAPASTPEDDADDHRTKRARTDAPTPDPALNRPGPCPMCGGPDCWVFSTDGKGWQLDCPVIHGIDFT